MKLSVSRVFLLLLFFPSLSLSAQEENDTIYLKRDTVVQSTVIEIYEETDESLWIYGGAGLVSATFRTTDGLSPGLYTFTKAGLTGYKKNQILSFDVCLALPSFDIEFEVPQPADTATFAIYDTLETYYNVIDADYTPYYILDSTVQTKISPRLPKKMSNSNAYKYLLVRALYGRQFEIAPLYIDLKTGLSAMFLLNAKKSNVIFDEKLGALNEHNAIRTNNIAFENEVCFSMFLSYELKISIDLNYSIQLLNNYKLNSMRFNSKRASLSLSYLLY